MYANWRSRRRSKAEGPGDGVGSTLTVVEAVVAMLDMAIDRSKLSRPVGRPGGSLTREGAWCVTSAWIRGRRNRGNGESKEGGGAIGGLKRWRKDIDWLEEVLREWQMNERSEKQEKRERIGEERERKDGRLVEAEMKRDEWQKEVRQGRDTRWTAMSGRKRGMWKS